MGTGQSKDRAGQIPSFGFQFWSSAASLLWTLLLETQCKFNLYELAFGVKFYHNRKVTSTDICKRSVEYCYEGGYIECVNY